MRDPTEFANFLAPSHARKMEVLSTSKMILPSFRSHFHAYISFGRGCYRDVMPSTLIWLDLLEATNPAHERTG
jgi:hypothetical protein